MKALRVLDKIFKEHDITYWLDTGTLLGAIREGKPIAWDFDIDISIFFKDLLEVFMLQKEFKKYGYRFQGFPKPGIYRGEKHFICVMPIKIYDKHLVQMFGWNLARKLGYFVSKYLRLTNLMRHFLFLFSLMTVAPRLKWGEYKWLGNFAYVEMCGDYYPIPEYVEEYLEYRYTSDWIIPIKGINWLKKEKTINSQRWYKHDEKAHVEV